MAKKVVTKARLTKEQSKAKAKRIAAEMARRSAEAAEQAKAEAKEERIRAKRNPKAKAIAKTELPRLLWREQTRPSIEFARGSKYSRVLIKDCCAVRVARVPLHEVDREYATTFCGKTIPDGLVKTAQMMKRQYWVTERAKAIIEDLLMAFDIESKTEPQILATCRLLIEKLPKGHVLSELPKRFSTKEKALERYNAIQTVLAAQAAAKADTDPAEDSIDKDKEKTMATAKKTSKPAKKAAPAKKTAAKEKKERAPRQTGLPDETKVVAKVKFDDVRMQAESRRAKTLIKVISAGAKGILVGTLKADPFDLKVLINRKYIAVVK